MEHQRSAQRGWVLRAGPQIPAAASKPLIGPSRRRLRRQLSIARPCCVPFAWAAGWVFRQQLRSPAGAQPSPYLKDQRGLSESTLESFRRSATPPIAGTAVARPSHPGGRLSTRAASKPPAWWSHARAAEASTTRFRHRGDVAEATTPGPGLIGFGGRSLGMAGEPKLPFNFPENRGVREGASTSFGLASRHLRHPQGRPGGGGGGLLPIVIALHRRRPHQLRWPRSARP